MGQRLLLQEIDKRVDIKLDKSIKADGVNGIMEFGQKNDYPQFIERLVNSSVTAKASAGIYSKFLTGGGFENEAINKVVVGKDARGKKITALSLLRQISDAAAVNSGFYIKRTVNLEGVTGQVELIPFKNCRFAKPDDTGYSAKIMVYDNWEKDKDKTNYNKSLITPYHIFNPDTNAIKSQMIADDSTPDNFKGQIYFQFFDNQYFYPLSPFDPAYMDCDTENQISIYKNNQIRNGFMDKVMIRIAPQSPELDDDGKPINDASKEMADSIRSFVGADGTTVFVMEDEVDENGNIADTGAFKIDKIEGNVNDKLFENWEKSLANSIRKCPRNIPNLLVEISDGIFSGQSGEAITQATNFYNAMTKDDRALISEAFAELFEKSAIPELDKNTNWSIKPLNLIENGSDINNSTTAIN